MSLSFNKVSFANQLMFTKMCGNYFVLKYHLYPDICAEGGALWGLRLSALPKGVGDNSYLFPLHSQGGRGLVHFGLYFA